MCHLKYWNKNLNFIPNKHSIVFKLNLLQNILSVKLYKIVTINHNLFNIIYHQFIF